MSLDRTFIINLYWGGTISYENGFVKGDHSTLTTLNIVRHKLQYEEFKDLLYALVLNISLCYEFDGKSNISRIISDSSLNVMYYLFKNDENYYVQVIIIVEKIAQEQVMPPSITSYIDLVHNFEVLEPKLSDVAFPLPNDDRFEADNDIGFDEANSQYSKDTSIELFSTVGEDSNDDDDDVSETRIMSFMNDVGDVGDADIIGLEDKIYVAKCKTLGDEGQSSTTMNYTLCCAWYVCAIKKKSSNVEDYTLGMAWKEKSHRHYLWNIRENFHEFPKYIAVLQASNPDMVVKWFHKPKDSSNVATFKYVFWAFGPAIDAFRLCRPVIFVDGCHLKGSYKVKLLVVVTKDANNNILPIAYAIVDEDSSYNWCWFFYQLRHFVAQDRQLCVISNRHQGIIHAMENLQEWK
uniref:MULE transposase domain-containing protein n=1 Tax=Lactuca sativa TaxID=4236 RepID=A0A9R1W1J9_LACSA|nr:hypothetical protein LSAT_V11C300152000 [Lactuca sativa]